MNNAIRQEAAASTVRIVELQCRAGTAVMLLLPRATLFRRRLCFARQSFCLQALTVLVESLPRCRIFPQRVFGIRSPFGISGQPLLARKNPRRASRKIFRHGHTTSERRESSRTEATPLFAAIRLQAASSARISSEGLICTALASRFRVFWIKNTFRKVAMVVPLTTSLPAMAIAEQRANRRPGHPRAGATYGKSRPLTCHSVKKLTLSLAEGRRPKRNLPQLRLFQRA